MGAKYKEAYCCALLRINAACCDCWASSQLVALRWPRVAVAEKVISLTRSRKIGSGNVTTAPLHVGPPQYGLSLFPLGRSELVADSCCQLVPTFQRWQSNKLLTFN